MTWLGDTWRAWRDVRKPRWIIPIREILEDHYRTVLIRDHMDAHRKLIEEETMPTKEEILEALEKMLEKYRGPHQDYGKRCTLTKLWSPGDGRVCNSGKCPLWKPRQPRLEYSDAAFMISRLKKEIEKIKGEIRLINFKKMLNRSMEQMIGHGWFSPEHKEEVAEAYKKMKGEPMTKDEALKKSYEHWVDNCEKFEELYGDQVNGEEAPKWWAENCGAESCALCQRKAASKPGVSCKDFECPLYSSDGCCGGLHTAAYPRNGILYLSQLKAVRDRIKREVEKRGGSKARIVMEQSWDGPWHIGVRGSGTDHNLTAHEALERVAKELGVDCITDKDFPPENLDMVRRIKELEKENVRLIAAWDEKYAEKDKRIDELEWLLGREQHLRGSATQRLENIKSALGLRV